MRRRGIRAGLPRDRARRSAARSTPSWCWSPRASTRYGGDPLAGMRLTARGYAALAAVCLEAAAGAAQGRAVFVLEGGYDLDGLASSRRRGHRAVLLGEPPAAADRRGPARDRASDRPVPRGARAVTGRPSPESRPVPDRCANIVRSLDLTRSMTDYDFDEIETRWQQRWAEARHLRGHGRPRPAEVLLPGDAALPLGRHPRRPRPQLLHHRRGGALQADARLQRAAPHRLGRPRACPPRTPPSSAASTPRSGRATTSRA